MSLKAFHIVFVTLTILLCAGFGIWALARHKAEGGTGLLVAAVASWVAIPILALYGWWFLKKLRHVSYL